MAWWDERRRLTAGYLTVWRRPIGPTRITRIAITIAILHVLAALIVTESGLALAVAVSIAAVYGTAGVWGVTIGGGLGWIAVSGVGFSSFVATLGIFTAGFIGRSLWLQLAYPYRRRLRVATVPIMIVSIICTAAGVGVHSVAMGLLTGEGIASTLPTLLQDQLLLAAILSPITIAVGAHRYDIPVSGMRVPIERWVLSVVLIGLTIALWLWTAFVLDQFRAAVAASPELLGEVLASLPTAEVLIAFAAGPWGWTLHLVFGLLTGILILLAIAIAQPRSHRVIWQRFEHSGLDR